MTTGTIPASIVIWDYEVTNRYADPDLDLDYIDVIAEVVAAALQAQMPIEVAFQPGDGTRYNLVLVPPRGLATAPPRRDWERHAISGVRASGVTASDTPADVYYADEAVLVVWVEQAAYPILLDNEFTADFLAQKFNTTIVSGCTLALLFRAVNWHLWNRSVH